MKDIAQRVYFAKAICPNGEPMGAYKIGCSHGFNDRIKQLSATLPFSLEVVATVPGGIITEAAVHLFLKEHRIAGEYFHANAVVEEFVAKAERRGSAFYHFQEGAALRGHSGIVPEASVAFMRYHGLSEDEIRKRIGTSSTVYQKQRAQRFGNRKWIAAMAVILCERGQFCTWPHDVLESMAGNVSPQIAKAA